MDPSGFVMVLDRRSYITVSSGLSDERVKRRTTESPRPLPGFLTVVLSLRRAAGAVDLKPWATVGFIEEAAVWTPFFAIFAKPIPKSEFAISASQ
jgi:hypothetical protein